MTKLVMWKGNLIPAEIAQLGAGPDAGSRLLTVRCDSCNEVFVLKDSDSAYHCQQCFDIAGLENLISDTDPSDPSYQLLRVELEEALALQNDRINRNQ